MKTPSQFTTAFHESVQLLLQLHFLMLNGKGDEPEADVIRNQSEAPWYRMTRIEQVLVDGLSADLYSVGVDRELVSRTPDLHIPAVFGPVIRRDWYCALDELRKREQEISPKDVAMLRAVCWEGIGEADVAIVFSLEAVRIAGTDPKPEAWLLQFLIGQERFVDALARSERILETRADSLLLLSAGSVFHSCAMKTDGDQANALIEKAIDAVDIALQQIGKSAAHEEVVRMAPRARLYQSLGYSRLGKLEKAIDACDDSLARSAGNNEARLLKAWLLRQENPVDSEAQFQQAFASGLGSRMHADLSVTTNAMSIN